MYEQLMQAYEEAKRRAEQGGVATTREAVYKNLAPVYAQFAKDKTTQAEIAARNRALEIKGEGMKLKRQDIEQEAELAKKALANKQYIYNKGYDLNKSYYNKMMPVNYANLAVSGLGSLGSILYQNKKDDQLQQRLTLLNKLYGG